MRRFFLRIFDVSRPSRTGRADSLQVILGRQNVQHEGYCKGEKMLITTRFLRLSCKWHCPFKVIFAYDAVKDVFSYFCLLETKGDSPTCPEVLGPEILPFGDWNRVE